MTAVEIALKRHTHGPHVLGDNVGRTLSMTWTLATTEFKLKFFGSFLGYLWSLIRPLALFGVLYFVFTTAFDIGDNVKFFPVYLLTGIILFTYFSECTAGCVTSLLAHESLLRKMRFPRIVVPLSICLTSFFNLCMNLTAVLIFALASSVPVTTGWLWMPVLILFLTIFGLGMGMMLSVLYVKYRDIQPIWDVLLQLGFYGSPILYTITSLPPEYQHPLAANPIAMVVNQMRHAFLDPGAPSAAAALGNDILIVIPIAFVLFLFVLGGYTFARLSPKVAELL